MVMSLTHFETFWLYIFILIGTWPAPGVLLQKLLAMLFKELVADNKEGYKYLRISAQPVFDFSRFLTEARVYIPTVGIATEVEKVYYSPEQIKESRQVNFSSFDVPIEEGPNKIIISIVAELDNEGPDEIITTLINDHAEQEGGVS